MVNYDHGFASYHLNPVDGLVIIVIQHESPQCITGDSWWIIHSQWQSLLERDWIIGLGGAINGGGGDFIGYEPKQLMVETPSERSSNFRNGQGMSGHSIRKDVGKLQGLPHR